jgi:hypothetical protein
MVNPYSAGTLTLQEAPSFSWRTNGLPLSRGTSFARRLQRHVGQLLLISLKPHFSFRRIFSQTAFGNTFSIDTGLERMFRFER